MGHTTLHLPCDIHAAHGMCGKMLDLVSGHCSGMTCGALSLSGHGQFSAFMRCFKEYLSEKLVILHAPASEEANLFRQTALDLFLPLPPSVRSAKYKQTLRRRLTISHLANGDWRERREVQHVCFGCCTSRDHTLWKFGKYLLAALVPGKVHILSRKNWTDAHRPFSQFGLVEACHGLLRSSFRRWVA